MDLPLRASLAGRLSARELATLERLWCAEAPAASQLEELIASHLRELRTASKTNEFLDLTLALAIADVLTQLVRGTRGADAGHRRLVAAAVSYFADAADSAHDTLSAIGLEDDARVANAVAEAIGRADLAIVIPE